MADPVVFESSFGVRFGIIICYDIDFAQPSTELIRSLGVENILFSTSWGSIPPLNTALLTQQGWARRMNVNLISANNAASPLTSGGGLIAAGGRIVNASFDSHMYNATTLLVGDLLVSPRSRSATQLTATLEAPDQMVSIPAVVDEPTQTSCTVTVGGLQQVEYA